MPPRATISRALRCARQIRFLPAVFSFLKIPESHTAINFGTLEITIPVPASRFPLPASEVLSYHAAMQKILAALLWTAVVLVAVFVIVTAIGMALPKDHVVSRTLTLEQHSPSLVYGIV